MKTAQGRQYANISKPLGSVQSWTELDRAQGPHLGPHLTTVHREHFLLSNSVHAGSSIWVNGRLHALWSAVACMRCGVLWRTAVVNCRQSEIM